MADPIHLEFKVTGPAVPAMQTVYIRSAWSDPWVEAPDLHCDSLTMAASPAIGAAQFSYRYGQRIQSEESSWENVARFAPNPRGYVKVVVAPTAGMSDSTTWVGVWRRATDFGLRQTFAADSIESLLAGCVIREAFYRDVFGAISKSGFGLNFNDRGRPNRSENKQPVRGGNCYVFEADPNRARWWSTRDVVEYLLVANPPLKTDDTTLFTWSLFDADVLPDFDRPTVHARNRDVLSVIQSLVSRFRLLSFRTEIEEVASPVAYTAVIVRPFTFTEESISITDYSGNTTGTIPANDWQYTLDLRHDPSSAASLSIQANHVADQVTVVGGWRQSVFSVSKEDGTLESTWNSDLEDEYVQAETTLDDAGELPDEDERAERQSAIRRLRNADRYRDVFAQWRLKEFWDQKAGDGIGGTKQPIALADNDADQYLIPNNLLEIESGLPFLVGFKYDGSTISTLETTQVRGHRAGDLFGGKWPHEPLPLSCYLKHGSLDSWSEISRLGSGLDLEVEDYTGKTAVSRNWSGTVRPVRGSHFYLRDSVEPGGLPEKAPTGGLFESPAIRVDVQGEEQHVLASQEFSARDDKISGSFNWREMILVVAVTDPRQIVVSYPETADLAPIGELVNEKLIDVGDEYRQIYVAPGTVVGVKEVDGTLLRSTGGYLQDDRIYLRQIAQRAYEWYRTPRYSLTFSSGLVGGNLKVGHMIQTIWDVKSKLAVGSAITEITIDFPVARGTQTPAAKITYVTAFGELDPARIF